MLDATPSWPGASAHALRRRGRQSPPDAVRHGFHGDVVELLVAPIRERGSE